MNGCSRDVLKGTDLCTPTLISCIAVETLTWARKLHCLPTCLLSYLFAFLLAFLLACFLTCFLTCLLFCLFFASMFAYLLAFLLACFLACLLVQMLAYLLVNTPVFIFRFIMYQDVSFTSFTLVTNYTPFDLSMAILLIFLAITA